MYSSPEEISQALERYRAHRFSVLEKIISMIEHTQPCEPSEECARHYESFRKEFLEMLLENRPLDIDKPIELLERWDHFKHIADITVGTSVDTDETQRISRREAFFSALEADLKEKSPEDIRGTIAVPPELRLLAEQVDGVWGPGLSEWTCRFHGAFFTLYDDPEIDTEVPYCPPLMDDETLEEFDVAIGAMIGHGSEQECWAVLSRVRDNSDQPWEWRYYINRYEIDSRVLDTIPDALSCLASMGDLAILTPIIGII
ncbi:hypothetical protein NPX13_g6465 [Xylaria arbuscula]|uniref:Uncharacterized protein n=1 Tax=Xylaria arbuscula TaxID=114810 RepID=A0A9W8NCH1_9PEZI|nr:hypothetical protein NPX13_g6465 [Xylaria arbuscula]